jgi:hypothetical protein
VVGNDDRGVDVGVDVVVVVVVAFVVSVSVVVYDCSNAAAGCPVGNEVGKYEHTCFDM